MSDDARQSTPGNPPEPETQTDFTTVNPTVGVRSPLAATQVGALIKRETDDGS